MYFLILAIISSSSIALIFKYTEENNMNRYAVTSANYFTAFILSFFMFIINYEGKNLFLKPSLSSFINESSSVLTSNGPMFSNEGSLFWAILVGVFAGIFFFLSFIYYQKSVNESGVGLSGTFGKLGILVPMIFSIVLWHELPSFIQWIGILLCLISIVIVNLSLEDLSLKSFNKTLILLFIFGGMAEFSNKIFQKYALIYYKDLFLSFVFLVAFLISIFFAFKQSKKLSKKDIFLGIIVGIPNLFSSFFLILSLNYMASSLVFPVYSAGSILLINLGGFILFNEKLSKKETLSIFMIVFALILINI